MNSPVRAFLSVLVFGFIGTGIYLGAVKGVNIYKEMEKSSLKKQISVKPGSIKGNQALVDPWSIDMDEFTFFDTLDDPSMGKFIGLNGNIIETPKATKKTSVFDSKVRKKTIPQLDDVTTKNSLSSVAHKIETQKSGESLASGFVLQVGSFKTLERAKLLKNSLGKKGYPVFVFAARKTKEGEIWHRVVIGGFTEKEFAVKAAIKVKQIENLDSVIKWQGDLKPVDSP